MCGLRLLVLRGFTSSATTASEAGTPNECEVPSVPPLAWPCLPPAASAQSGLAPGTTAEKTTAGSSQRRHAPETWVGTSPSKYLVGRVSRVSKRRGNRLTVLRGIDQYVRGYASGASAPNSCLLYGLPVDNEAPANHNTMLQRNIENVQLLTIYGASASSLVYLARPQKNPRARPTACPTARRMARIRPEKHC